MPRPLCPPEFLPFAHRLADASGEVVRRYFRSPFVVEGKADASPVTVADRETELVLRELIAQERPEDGLIGEEHGASREDAEFVWVIDPIDGTRAFAAGKPLFGTLIALLQGGVPIIGVIDQPVLRERWIGAAGHHTQFNGKDCRVRACSSLENAVANLGPMAFPHGEGAELGANRLMDKAAKTTTVGGDCYSYGLLASGYLDLVMESRLKLYDFAALVPVVQGAGGTMTDWQGNALGLDSPGEVLAVGDRRVAQEALKMLRGAA
ncbi:MAG: histidinol phosphate phosphatase [Alphaproteobacteria bacterium]|nr:histidinol phosphate phosphatase [Alphaproteobacteria bacterium]